MSSASEDPVAGNTNPATIIKTSACIYYGILGAGILFFELARRYLRSVYRTRKSLHDAEYMQRTSNRLLGWLTLIYTVDDDQILDRCGLDTLTFFRFLRLGQKFSILSLLSAVILFPIYAAEDNSVSSDPLIKITMTNLKSNDSKLWVSVACTYVLCGYMMYLLWKEYLHYTDRRHHVLSLPMPPQYTVLFQDLPIGLRSATTLRTYLERIFPNEVRSVYVAVDCENLEKIVKERVETRNKLEHALAEYEVHGKRPRHRVGRCCFGAPSQDSIEIYTERLNTLNQMVGKEIGSIHAAQRILARAVEEYDQSFLSPTFDYYTSPTKCTEHHLRVNDMVEGYESKWEKVGPDGSIDESISDYVQMKEKPSNDHRYSAILPKFRDTSTQAQVIELMRPAAFVSFNSLTSAHICQQTLQSRHPTKILVEPAPHVDDVNWSNVGVEYRKRSIWRLVSTVFTVLIVLFWTIPVAFVASLTTTNALRTQLPFLGRWMDQAPILQDVFNQIGPLALAGMNALAPMIFRFLSEKEGHISDTQVRASFFTKLAYFQLIQIFFVTVIVGTILDSIRELVEQPSHLVSMLGRSMPQQSTFFMSYVIILTGLNLILELLRVKPLIMAAIFQCCAPKLTPREKEGEWLLRSRPITKTDPFDPTSALADCFLVMLVTMTFATIAPLVCLFTGFFFFAADAVYRRQVLFVYDPTTFAMGAYWPYLFRFMIIAIVISQLTLLGLLSVKQSIGPPILIFALIFTVLLYAYYVGKLYPKVAANLSLMECTHMDTLRHKPDSNISFDFLDNVYRQPAMHEDTLVPEYPGQ